MTRTIGRSIPPQVSHKIGHLVCFSITMNIGFVLLCRFVLLLLHLGLFTPVLSFRKPRKEIVVRRIKSPSFDTLNPRYSIDDTGLHYDYDSAETNADNVGEDDDDYDDASVCYLATWKDDTRIIGNAQVSLDWEYGRVWEEDEKKYKEVRVLQGLELASIRTSRKHRRKGVGTALIQSIERDAPELLQSMETSFRKSNPGCDIRPPKGSIQLRLYPCDSNEALRFYKSLGFSWAHRGDQQYDDQTLGTKLKLIWKHITTGDTVTISSSTSRHRGYMEKTVNPNPV